MPSTTSQALFDLSRGRQALLSVAQPGLGALLATGTLPSVRIVSLGLVAATCGYLAVFSLNDVLDRASDVDALDAGKAEFVGFDIDTAFDRHPLASGLLRMRTAVVWVAALAAVAIVCAWLLNPLCVALFAVSALLEVAYCVLRHKSWVKTFLSGIMVGVGALAGWVAAGRLTWHAGAFFLFLAAWEIAGRNLPNDLADLKADTQVGLTTVATVFGPASSARAIFAGSVVTTGLVVFVVPSPEAVVVSLTSSLALMIWPASVLQRTPTPEQAARYFNRASLLPAVVFLAVLAVILVGGR